MIFIRKPGGEEARNDSVLGLSHGLLGSRRLKCPLSCSCFEHFAQLWRLSIVQVVISDVSRAGRLCSWKGEATLRPGADVRWENH